MILHLPTVQEVSNSYGKHALEELMEKIVKDAPNRPDIIMEFYDFPLKKLMGNVDTHPPYDYQVELESIKLGFRLGIDQGEADIAVGSDYIGDIVELKLPTFFPVLLNRMYQRGELADTMGFLVNLVMARAPTSGVRTYRLLSFFIRYYGYDGLRVLLKEYTSVMRGIKQRLDKAGLSIHIASNNLHRVVGTAFYIPGTEAQVAGALTEYLDEFAHVITLHKALIVYQYAADRSCDVLSYDEFGVPNERNRTENELFSLEVQNFYRKRKLQALLSS